MSTGAVSYNDDDDESTGAYQRGPLRGPGPPFLVDIFFSKEQS